MVRFFELAGSAVAETYRAVVAWLRDQLAAMGGGSLDPRTWGSPAWVGLVVAALLVALAAAWRARLRARRRLPEMLISHGEISVGEHDDRPGGEHATSFASGAGVVTGREPHYLQLALSNLTPYPVQLIELAVRTRGGRLPVVAEAGAVVPPHGAVDVAADLFDVAGEAVTVELYLFSGRVRGRTFRLTAPLEWEPWSSRYRIRALDGRSEGVARLASAERRAGERHAFEAAKRRERRRELARLARERTESLRRQVEEYRVARAERSRAAAEVADAAVSGVVAVDDTRRRAAVGQDGATVVPVQAHPPPAEQPSEPRPELRFPDEF